MIHYIGLDFEASGSNPWGRHVPIQIGMQVGRSSFVRLIGRWDWNEFEWDEEAAGVHNIEKAVLVSVPPVWAVDIEAAAWLMDQVGYTNRMFNIAVGWGVGSYDRQFIHRWMPNLDKVISRRTLDLNALVLAYADTEEAYKGIKAGAKKYANEQIGITEASRHDALIDASCALYELEYLRGWVK